MKTFLFNSLNRFRRYSKELDTMAEIRKCLCGKAWQVFNNSGDKEVYIFQEDGRLIISINGIITKGSWEYLSENNSIAISASNQAYMVHPAFLDNILFALQVDGTENYTFLIDQQNVQNFAPRSLDDLHQYFRQKEQKRIEEENRIREEQLRAEQKRIEEANRIREEQRLAEQKRIEEEQKERAERERRKKEQREEEQKNRLAEKIYKDEIIKSFRLWLFVAYLFALLSACWSSFVLIRDYPLLALICLFLGCFSFKFPYKLIFRFRLKKFIKNNRTYSIDMLYRLVKYHNDRTTSFDIEELNYYEFKKLILDQIPTNEIHYTTKDNRFLSLSLSGVQILSHLYCQGINLFIVKFDKDVTEIGCRAFSECSSLTSITIPPSVTKIGDSAFYDCSSLWSIAIPPSVTEIGDSAFYGCSSLMSIAIPPSVTEIGFGAFSECSSLTSITIPPSVTKIGDSAFADCESLMRITIPESVTKIGNSAFYQCKNLKSIPLPRCLKKIGNSAFWGCYSLTSIIIHPSVTEIGNSAFSGCFRLTSITIPPSVTKIGVSAFSHCSCLTSITVSKDNKFYDSREDCNAIIHTESNTLISGCKNTIIPPSVTKIEVGAFNGCKSLTSISIPESVTEIGDKAFWGCSSLTGITIPQSVEEIGEDAFWGCKCLTSISIPPSVTEIGKRAFYGCSSLTSITVSKNNKVYDSREDCNAIIHTESNTLIRGCMNTVIPPSVTEIEESAFSDCKNLTSIAIPESVTKIGKEAFYGCKSLTSIIISPSVTEIGNEAFAWCSSLMSISIPPSVTQIGVHAFCGCSSLTRIIVSKDNKVYDSREDCNGIIHTESNTLISGCNNTIIPESVTKIGDWAFSRCSSLTSITIPPSVTEIGGWAFDGCSSLTEVRIPKGCNVDGLAFMNCPNVQIIRY